MPLVLSIAFVEHWLWSEAAAIRALGSLPMAKGRELPAAIDIPT